MSGSELVEVIILGVVQGISEFLPISSSGHLVIVDELMRQISGRSVSAEGSLQMNIALHVGTLLSILVVYRTDLLKLLWQPRLCGAIVLATLPVVVVGFTLKDHIEHAFQTPLAAGCGLLATAGFLLAGQRFERNSFPLENFPLRCALAVGLFQAIAIMPGISRSGSTIAGGLLSGLRRDAATTFSFFIAIPAISGAAVLMAKDLLKADAGAESPAALLIGAIVAFLVGIVALRTLLRIISQRRLHWFAYYCLTVAVLTISWQLLARPVASS
jgi:undecaprenyl-diphosphatase